MSEIALRTYVEQLDSLIERKQVDEVLAHCRHILSLYPKHLDTYRMLGKALLEKGRHTDAADIFQRVLSVAPDDFIAHVGMSIVREDETNLDSAIWHMERAFETSPSNGAIQQELCRLYGRRDGVTPPKARLTRGALARMYSQGGLFVQAEAELKAALSEDPERIDLLTLLARVYWQSGQPAEAAQVCAAILQKLPYSVEANRILSAIFREQDRAAEAAAYRARLEALDPYEAFVAAGQNGAVRKVEAGRITLQRLEYVPGADDGSSPDWLTSIGAKFEEPEAKAAEATPEWLNSEADTPAPVAPADLPLAGELPDWLRDLQPLPPAAAITPEPTAPPGAPDWLRDLGLGSSPLPQNQPANEDLPDWLKTATGPLPAEAVPDWMLPAFKEPSQPTGPEPEAVPEADLPEWLSSLTAASAPPEEAAPPEAAPSPVSADSLDTWLGGAPPTSDEDLPDWMRAAQQPAGDDADETPPAAEPSEPIVPALAFGLADTLIGQPPVSEPAQDETEVRDWLEPAAQAEPAAELPAGEDVAEPSADLPDWLRAAAATDPNAAELPEWMRTGPLAETPASDASPAAPAPAADLDDETLAWLQSAAAEASLTGDTPSDASDSPPWAASAEPEASASLAAPAEPPLGLAEPAVAPEPTPEPAPSAELDDTLPDWLRAPEGTIQPPAPEASLPVSAEEPADEGVPAWLRAPEPGDQPPAPPEIPDWLRTVAATAPVPDAGPPDVQGPEADAPAEAVELPDFLQPASADAIARSEQPFSFDEESESEEDDFSDEPDEPDLVLPAEIPAWLQALAPLAPDPTPPAEPAAADEPETVTPPTLTPALAEAPASTPPEEETPEWLADLGAPAAEATPPWLAELTGQTADVPPTDSLVVPASEADLAQSAAQDLPPWAEAEAPGPTDTIVSWLQGRSQPPTAPPPAAPEPSAAPVQPEASEPEPVEPAPPEPAAELPPWAEAEAPGATDTILTWLSGRQSPPPAAEAASPPEPEPAQPAAFDQPAAEAAGLDEDEALRWLESLAAQQGANPEELITSPDERPTATPAWIAAQQAASVDEAGQADEPLASAESATPEPAAEAEPPLGSEADLPDWLRSPATEPETPAWLADVLGQSASAGPVEPEATAAETGDALAEPEPEAAAPLSDQPILEQEPAAPASEPLADAPELEAPSVEPDAPSLEAWLSQMEQSLPVDALADTAPTKPHRVVTADSDLAVEPVAEAPSPETEAAAEPDLAEMDPEEALRWLEGLAARQGADPEALLTRPEDRLTETPAWISALEAESPAISDQPEPTLSETSIEPETLSETEAVAEDYAGDLAELAALVPAEPEGEAPEDLIEPVASEVAGDAPATELEADDDAMRWLETLAARQGAQPEELLTPEAERTAEIPAWIAAEQLDEPEPAPLAEPEPATEFATPDWVRSETPVEPPSAEPPAPVSEAPLEPPPPAEPPAPVEPQRPAPIPPPPVPPSRRPETGDLTRLSRLAERLAESRRAREAEIEARFAEQRAEQAAARRLVQERMESKRAEPETPATPAAPVPVAPPIPEPAPAPDFAAAAEHYAAWVASGDHVDQAIRELETLVNQHPPTAPVLRVLGDAYARQDRLTEALDAYRMALERL